MESVWYVIEIIVKFLGVLGFFLTIIFFLINRKESSAIKEKVATLEEKIDDHSSRGVIEFDREYTLRRVSKTSTRIMRTSDGFVSPINTHWHYRKSAVYTSRDEIDRINFYKKPNQNNQKEILKREEEYTQIEISPTQTIIIRNIDNFLSDVNTDWDDRRSATYKNASERLKEIRQEISNREEKIRQEIFDRDMKEILDKKLGDFREKKHKQYTQDSLAQKKVLKQGDGYLQVQLSPTETRIVKMSDFFVSEANVSWDDREATIYKTDMEKYKQIANLVNEKPPWEKSEELLQKKVMEDWQKKQEAGVQSGIIQENDGYMLIQLSPTERRLVRLSDLFVSEADVSWENRETTAYKRDEEKLEKIVSLAE